MKGLLVAFFTWMTLSGFSQNFVSSAIIAYHSGAYERTIKDIDRSMEQGSDLDRETRAKAYYYRGMARLQLKSKDPGSSMMSGTPLITAFNDLNQARLLDDHWQNMVDEEMNALYDDLILQMETSYGLGVDTDSEDSLKDQLNNALAHLNTAVRIKKDRETNTLYGKIHRAFGDFYYMIPEDQEAYDLSLENYRQAVGYYEASLDEYIRSVEKVKALKELHERLGNTEKMEEYRTLELYLGG